MNVGECSTEAGACFFNVPLLAVVAPRDAIKSQIKLVYCCKQLLVQQKLGKCFTNDVATNGNESNFYEFISLKFYL